MFSVKLKSNSGRNSKGKITVFSKGKKTFKSYSNIDNSRIWNVNLGIIKFINLNNLNNIIGLVKYSNGSISSIKLAYGLNIGSFIKSTILPIRLYKISLLGFRVFLSYLKANMIFFDLGVYGKKNNYVTSNGSFSQVIQVNKDLKLILVLLPSGKKKFFTPNYICTLGRNNNIFQKFLVLGKAGSKYKLGSKSIVRGVAMNPVDHPHGGRTKTNQPEVSPWGWVTKHSH